MTFNSDIWDAVDFTPNHVIDAYRVIAFAALGLFAFFAALTMVTSSSVFGLITVVLMAIWVLLGILIRRAVRLRVDPM